MLIDYTQYLALVYADIFDFPLRRREIREWAIKSQKKKVDQKKIGYRGGLFFFKDNKKLVELRKEREEISLRKLKLIKDRIKKLQTINSIEAIFVTGSVAAMNAKENADLDLMIIVKPGTVWKTRLRALFLLRKTNELRDREHSKDRICANMFLDTNHLEIEQKNLYTAHEILLAKCLFDQGGIREKWQRENLWVREFLPKAFKGIKVERNTAKTKFWITNLVEIGAFVGQYLYMLPKITNEKIGFGFAFFHPVDGSKIILARFEKRLSELA